MRTPLRISHPGSSLARLIARSDNEVSKETLLRYIKDPQLNGLLKKEISVSLSLAQELEFATGVSAAFWISRQRNYDHQLALQIDRERL